MAGILELSQVDRITEPTHQEMLKGFQAEDFRFLQMILENEKNHPEELDKLFWPFFDKEQALTNFTDVDVKVQMENLHIAILNYKMSIPDYRKTYNDIIHLDNMRAKLFAKVKRSTGGLNRERAIQATHIKQLIANEQEVAKGGILSRIGGIFRGRR